ncbi:MAG: glycosyltransferase [Candidatus Helarchaeota archaeon]
MDDWFEKLLYYLENEDERAKIARNGYNTVMKYHTADVRAKQFVRWLKKK